MAVETQTMPVMNGHAFDGDFEMENDVPSLRFTSGLILPPPDIKCKFLSLYRALVFCGIETPGIFSAVIDRTALFVARSANPPQFEDKIRENQRQDPKFSFLNPADPYHAYYRHRMDRIAAGEELDDSSEEKEKTTGVEETPVVPEDLGVEPPQPQFAMDMPSVSHIDLCVLGRVCRNLTNHLCQRYHETDRTFHCPPWQDFLSDPFAERGKELSVRLLAAHAFSLWSLQPPRRAISQNSVSGEGTVGGVESLDAGGREVGGLGTVKEIRPLGTLEEGEG